MNFQNEIARSRAFFKAYAIDEQSQDKLNMLASMVKDKIKCEWGLVTFIAYDKHVTQSVAGDGVAGVTPRELSFCNETIKSEDPLVIENTEEDDFFKNNVYSKEPFNIRFYAGIPIKTPDNYQVGALAACGTKPHKLKKTELNYMKDLARLVELEIESVYMSSTDELTGLINRRAFQIIGKKMVSYAYSEQQDVTGFFFDLDKFKNINDTFGHAAGDDALKTFSDIMRVTFRGNDLMCRYGGDEFTALCMNLPSHNVDTILQRMQDAAMKLCLDKKYNIEFSVGVTTCSKSSLQDMISSTDKKMYEMKFEGKNG